MPPHLEILRAVRRATITFLRGMQSSQQLCFIPAKRRAWLKVLDNVLCTQVVTYPLFMCNTQADVYESSI